MKKTVVIAGSLAQKPRHGGHTWVFLQYLLGFRRLGWEVLLLDRLDAAMCADASGRSCGVDESVNLEQFLQTMNRYGLNDSFCLVCDGGSCQIGLSKEQALERVREAPLFINVMGFLKDEEFLSCARRRVFLDIDPGFGQMWRELGLDDPFAGHDDFVTIGENIGRPGCGIPTCGLRWINVRQPIVLEHWRPVYDPGEGAFTGVASWRGAYGPVEYRRKTYGLRVHEFRKFAPLPRLSRRPFRLALDIHPSETNDLALLAENDWSLVDPKEAAGDTQAYQEFIRASAAEFMVAKNMYVQSHSGWFSDRSICYLASGKPVLAQDTGLEELFPTGEGLLTFGDLEEALAGVEEISNNYSRHARVARALAEEYFDSDKVLRGLLDELGV